MNLYSGNSIQFSNALHKKITQWSSAQVFETSVNVTSSKIIIINKIISIIIILIIILLCGLSSDI